MATAVASSGSFVVPLATGLNIAIPATASSIDLIHNKYWNVVIGPTTKTHTTVGVACAAIAASQGGWIQTAGPCSVLTEGTLVAGNFVTPSLTTAGAVTVGSAVLATTVSDNQIGRVMRVGATAAWSLIDLQLDN